MSSWLSTLMFGKDPGQSSTGAAFQSATARRGNSAQAADSAYQAADANFDPASAFSDYTKGAIGDFHTQLAKELTALKGSSVGAGRLNTGFFDEDQGKVATDLGTNLQNNLDQHALDVAGLQEQDLNRRGNYSLNVNQDYNDMLAGQLDRETAAQNAKRAQRGALLGGIASVAGAALGRH